MTAAAHEDVVAALTAHLQERTALYLPGHDRAAVRLLRADERVQSRLYRFQLCAGGCRRTLLVKLGLASPAPSRAAIDRPRIAPCADGSWAADSEYRALALIHRRFAGMGDPRFGSIAVFDRLPDRDGFVMEAVDWRNLRTLSLRRGRLPWAAGRRDLLPVFRNAGAWLRIYHQLDAPPAAGDVQPTRADFVEFTDALTRYLEPRTGERPFLMRVRDALGDAAATHLPARLPLALAHGDYAMRNILVGPAHRVTVLDTLARFRACVYRDVGYFLADLAASPLAAWSSGSLYHPSQIAGYRAAFLEGYFDGAADAEPAVRLYEVQTTLERWSSLAAKSERSAMPRRAVAMAAAAVFKQAIRDRLSQSR